MTRTSREDRRLRRQRGHLMAGLMALIAIMMIFSTVVFQEWSAVIRRDNEAEMMFRAQDIVRAIQRYRKDHGGAGPLEFELLMEPGPRGQYYLRRLYTDPLVKDGNWGLLFVGPGGTIVDPNLQIETDGGIDRSPFGGSVFNQQSQGQRGAGRQGQLGQSGQPGQQGQPGQPGQPGGQGLGQPQVLVGEGTGLPIAGVKSLCEESPFRVYKGLTEYSEWLFTYLDLELAQNPTAGAPGTGGRQGAGGTGRPGFNQPGQPTGGSGLPGGVGNRGRDRRNRGRNAPGSGGGLRGRKPNQNSSGQNKP